MNAAFRRELGFRTGPLLVGFRTGPLLVGHPKGAVEAAGLLEPHFHSSQDWMDHIGGAVNETQIVENILRCKWLSIQVTTAWVIRLVVSCRQGGVKGLSITMHPRFGLLPIEQAPPLMHMIMSVERLVFLTENRMASGNLMHPPAPDFEEKLEQV